MKVAVLSDIHAEFYKNDDWLPPLPTEADVLVLAGDIAIGPQLEPVVSRISRALPNTDIVLIAGNHEYYRQPRQKTLKGFRQAFTSHPKIHFLENDYVDIQDVRFIGATLWTGFKLFDETDDRDYVKALIQSAVSDFRLIVEDGIIDKNFSPLNAEKLFNESCTFIESVLKTSDPAKTIVVTHFPPLPQLHHPSFPVDWLSSYFTADCSDLIKRYVPAYWIYGHNHWSHQEVIGRTHFVSNQYGYPNEAEEFMCNFDPELLITI